MAHASLCHGCKKGCAMCKFGRLKQTWRLRLGESPEGEKHWLAARFTKKGFGVGCRVCAAKGLHTAFARFAVTSKDELQLITFKRHSELPGTSRVLGQTGPRGEGPLEACSGPFLGSSACKARATNAGGDQPELQGEPAPGAQDAVLLGREPSTLCSAFSENRPAALHCTQTRGRAA